MDKRTEAFTSDSKKYCIGTFSILNFYEGAGPCAEGAAFSKFDILSPTGDIKWDKVHAVMLKQNHINFNTINEPQARYSFIVPQLVSSNFKEQIPKYFIPVQENQYNTLYFNPEYLEKIEIIGYSENSPLEDVITVAFRFYFPENSRLKRESLKSFAYTKQEIKKRFSLCTKEQQLFLLLKGLDIL